MKRVVVAGAVLVGCSALGLALYLLPGPPESTWPAPLKDPEARALLKRECRRASEQQKLLLIEFSAPFCEHCQAVKETLRAPEFERLLARYRTVLLNIGNDDELDSVRLDLEARAIPAWVVVRPNRCDSEPRDWQRLANTYPRGDAQKLQEFLKPHGEG